MPSGPSRRNSTRATPLIRERYEPIRQIARGGQGEVVLALDTVHDRRVALKVRRFRGSEERERLLSEARLLFSVRPHSSLPLVREDFVWEDGYYLVMEWVEGTSLQTLLDERGPLPYALVVPYLTELAQALEHLHAHSPPIVHGDVKPSNVVVTPAGRVVLVDFGLARQAPEGGAEPAGTPGFMAPEVLAGDRPAPASDIYALGATAVALLSGRPPEGPRPGWGSLPHPGVMALEDALEAALASDPASRPTSAPEVVERLTSWIRGHLPTGTVTLLITDVEGSTRMWEANPHEMRAALVRHDRLVAGAVERYRGLVVKPRGEGDSVFAVFERASDALAGALEVQRVLRSEPWPETTPVRVRAALHSGGPELREFSYYGPDVNRCARLRAVAHGGQVVLSAATAALVRQAVGRDDLEHASLLDLGLHRLKDLTRPERIFQCCHPDLPSEFPPLLSLDAARHNLPVQLTSFVERGKEMTELRELLSAGRLLTLTGAAGSGKTRLALQAGAELADEFPDGVWLAELAPVSEPGTVAERVAAILGLREVPGQPVLETLLDYLRSRRLLLILDNCEHLISATAGLADVILRSCANARILATSREPLRIQGEVVQGVPSLPAPAGEQASVDAVYNCEATRLFVDRARELRPEFSLDEGGAIAVAEICRRLDGIPLAIELAAARVAALSPQQIVSRLNDRFRLLTGGGRTAPPRHRTLRAMVDWSYDLLPAREQTLFARLSVFAGRFTLDAAESICATDYDDASGVMDLLSDLVAKSLVAVSEDGDEHRYRLLETFREYADEKLAASGAGDFVRARHLGWCLDLAERAGPLLNGPEGEHFLDLLEAEQDNLRSALEWACVNDRQRASALAAELCRFWFLRSHLVEGRRWLNRVLDFATPPHRTKLLDSAGVFAQQQGDLAEARRLYEEQLALARRADDREGVAGALNGLGILCRHDGDLPGARAYYEQNLEILREIGNVQNIGACLNNIGVVAHQQGDVIAARSCFEQTLDIARSVQDLQGIGSGLGNLGHLAMNDGDYALARSLYEQSLDIERRQGRKVGIALKLTNAGVAARYLGDYEAARAMIQEGLELRRALGNPQDVALSLVAVGDLACDVREYAEAARVYGEVLDIQRSVGDRPGMLSSLTGTADLAAATGDGRLAARLLGAVEAAREAGGSQTPTTYVRRIRDRIRAAAVAACGEEGVRGAWAEGRAMSLDEAAACATTALRRSLSWHSPSPPRER